MKLISSLIFFLISLICFANELPKLNQCNIEYKGQGIIEVSYELIDPDNTQLEIKCIAYDSDPSPRKYMPINFRAITGDIGKNINPGFNKKILFELNDMNDIFRNIRFTLSAYDNEVIDINELVKQVSIERMQNDLLSLQGKRNETTDKTFKDKSRLYITNILQQVEIPIKFESKVGNLTNINYEANLWGIDSPSIINVVDAHYDSFGQAPGADDNASGVVGTLEIFRILSQYSSLKTARFLFFDLEENGLVGSNLYLNNQLNQNDRINNVINFEMIGYYSDQDNTQDLPTGFNILFPAAYNEVITNNRKGNFITNVGNTNSKSLIQNFIDASNKYVSNLKVISLEVPGNGSVVQDLRRSDHANFWDKGYKALMITDGANFRNKNYHTLKDSVQYLNMDFMSNVVMASLATIAQLIDVQHGTSKSLDFHGIIATSNPKAQEIHFYQSGDQIIIHSDNNYNMSLNIINTSGIEILNSSFNGNFNFSKSNLNSTGLLYLQVNSKNKSYIYKFMNER